MLRMVDKERGEMTKDREAGSEGVGDTGGRAEEDEGESGGSSLLPTTAVFACCCICSLLCCACGVTVCGNWHLMRAMY